MFLFGFSTGVGVDFVCVTKLIDGRISIPEQRLRGECRTDRTASDDANGPEKEATGTSKARLRDGTSPIADLEPQSINDRDHSHKCRVKLERLRDLGHELRRPEADYLRDGIYELRVRVGSANYRMLYFFHENIAAVVSHGLTKEKRVPPKDIDRAVAAKQRFVQAPGRHTHQEH
jgi:phage-related protein